MSSISKGLSLELKSISENFIDSYLDSLKGIKESKSIVDLKISNEAKAYKIYKNVIKFHEESKEDFKEDQWSYIENNVIENLYKQISKNEIVLMDRVL